MKTDNFGRLIHDSSGLALGNRSSGADTINSLVLAQSGTPVSLTGTLAEIALATILIPAGVLGLKGSLRVSADFTSATANLKTGAIRFGGAALGFPFGTGNNSGFQLDVVMRNRGASNVQRSRQYGITTSGALAINIGAHAVNSAVDQLLTITGLLSSVADTITLEGYTIEILPGA